MGSPISRGMLFANGPDLREVRRATGCESRIDPVSDDLGIREDLVPEPEERNVHEVLEQVIADGLRQLLPFARIHGLIEFRERRSDELVFERMRGALRMPEVADRL